MRKEFFESEIGRLISAYGERSYSGERLEVLWRRYHKISAEEFKQAVDNLLINSRFAPLAVDFDAQLATAMRNAKDQEMQELQSGESCPRCRNTGRISVKLVEGMSHHTFSCSCKIGRKLFPNFPVYNHANIAKTKLVESQAIKPTVTNQKPISQKIGSSVSVGEFLKSPRKK